MTGRDLIMYILQNNLEDKPIYSDGGFIGFISAEEAAVKYHVGVDTIKAWFALRYIDGFKIGEELYVPAYYKSIDRRE